MDKKLSELKERFIIYYSEDNYIHIYSTPVDTITVDEFMKYDIPCKDCLVQSMCITGQNKINDIVIKDGIKLKLCEKMEKFICQNRPFFNRVTLHKGV